MWKLAKLWLVQFEGAGHGGGAEPLMHAPPSSFGSSIAAGNLENICTFFDNQSVLAEVSNAFLYTLQTLKTYRFNIDYIRKQYFLLGNAWITPIFVFCNQHFLLLMDMSVGRIGLVSRKLVWVWWRCIVHLQCATKKGNGSVRSEC